MRGSGRSARRHVGDVYDESGCLLFCYSCLSCRFLWLLVFMDSNYAFMYLFVFEYALHCNKYLSFNIKPLNIYIKLLCSSQ